MDKTLLNKLRKSLKQDEIIKVSKSSLCQDAGKRETIGDMLKASRQLSIQGTATVTTDKTGKNYVMKLLNVKCLFYQVIVCKMYVSFHAVMVYSYCYVVMY